MAETLRTNINRQHYLSIIALPVSIAHIVYFYFFLEPLTFEEQQWRNDLMIAHSVLVIMFGITIFFTSRYRKKNEIPKWLELFLLFQMIILFLSGAAIASIDQLVTPNITPFLIVSVLIGIVFLTPFVYTMIIFSFGYVVFFYTIGLAQGDEFVLISNRVNGLTTVSLGIGLSYVLWKAHCTAVFQSRFIQQQNEDLERKNKELYQLASIDLLTGLYTRRHFEEIMKEKVDMLMQQRQTLSVIVLDIDHFKHINDNWGHPVGDVVLKEVSSCLLKERREHAIIARWGGEEFVIALFGKTLTEAKEIAELFRQAIVNRSITVDKQIISVTASFGIAQVNEVESFCSFHKAYEHADQALYKAKQSGRNCVKVFEA